MMDPESEKNLAQIDPALAEKIRTAAASCTESALYFCVYSGFRTVAQQDSIYAEGRTAPGPIRTNDKGGHSMHNYGLAADIVPFMGGQSGTLNWNPDTAQYRAMVSALKAQGLAWGGDWIHFKDMDHFQMPHLPANPTPLMVADLTSGMSLPAIWIRAAGGNYS